MIQVPVILVCEKKGVNVGFKGAYKKVNVRDPGARDLGEKEGV